VLHSYEVEPAREYYFEWADRFHKVFGAQIERFNGFKQDCHYEYGREDTLPNGETNEDSPKFITCFSHREIRDDHYEALRLTSSLDYANRPMAPIKYELWVLSDAIDRKLLPLDNLSVLLTGRSNTLAGRLRLRESKTEGFKSAYEIQLQGKWKSLVQLALWAEGDMGMGVPSVDVIF